MAEYFITARSCAAPFFSDPSDGYVEAPTAHEALRRFKKSYKHPAGLFAAEAWASADAYHKNVGPLAEYRSEKAKKQETELA